MIEKKIESPLGYVKGCLRKGVPLSSWELILKDGVVWLENSLIQVRITGKMQMTCNQIAPCIKEATNSKANSIVWGKIPTYETDERKRRIELARLAGLLGSDRVY
ncbi:MAG: hypothetical protein QXZ70_03540 [Candidatus Bathyarchaeia archaeon]